MYRHTSSTVLFIYRFQLKIMSIKWKQCLKNSFVKSQSKRLARWRRRSERRAEEWTVTQVKWRKDWRMNCDVGKATEGLENELWRRWRKGLRMSSAHSRAHSPSFPSLHERHSLFSNPSVALPTSQLILLPFHRFTYVTVHSPTLLSFLLRQRLFTYVTWRATHPTMGLPYFEEQKRGHISDVYSRLV